MKNLFEELKKLEGQKNLKINLDEQYNTAEVVYPVDATSRYTTFNKGRENLQKIEETVEAFFPGMSPKLAWTENGGIAFTSIVLEIIEKNKDLKTDMDKKIGTAAQKRVFIGNFGFVINGYGKDGKYLDTFVLEWEKIPEPSKPADKKSQQPQQKTS
ncbi:MAG: hypothetical protein WC650_01515 [Candidatus Doudnabacteria bacterium]